MALHPYVSFRGVFAHLDVQFTLAHGTAPSQCQIRIPPTDGIEEGGPLVLNFGGRSIVFPDCKVDRIDVARNSDGLEVWTLTVLDRRWKWKECGQVSGYYNVREGENASAEAGIPKQVKAGTEKNLRDLMRLCLDAMGETGYDVSRVPDDIFPEVEWDYEIAASALAKLADVAKLRIVLTLRNRVELWQDGDGQKLTKQGTTEYQLTADPPERPDQLIFVGHRMLWEQDLPLEAVARDADGKYWPINSENIPYRPDVTPVEGNYWWAFDSEFGNAIFDKPAMNQSGIKTYRDLAKADVYRKYRIKTPLSLVTGQQVVELDQILPLLSLRLATSNENKPQPPVLWGLFSRDEAAPEYFGKLNDPRSKLEVVNPPKDMRIEEGFQVDEKTGIVTCDRPRYQFGKKQGGFEVETGGEPETVDWPFMKPAVLWLRIGFGLRASLTRAWTHKEIVRRSQQKKFGTKPRYVTAADAIYRIISGQSRIYENVTEYEKMANHYLDLEEQKYEPRDPCAATYPGLVDWSPDGAIQQVTWSITERGATTRVSRNREEPILGLTYEEQRLYQQLKQKIVNDPATSREADDRAKRRVA